MFWSYFTGLNNLWLPSISKIIVTVPQFIFQIRKCKMFASCSNIIRINSWPSELLKENSEFVLQNDAKISHLSWCNDNSYIAILQQGEKPQILSTKDLNNIRTVHTINDHFISSIVFKKGTKKHLAMGTRNGDVMIYDTKLRSVSRYVRTYGTKMLIFLLFLSIGK